ncbi:hypothetical protein [Dishui Lake phycodnavirus 4]|nr:hypothetical protein [Dishui Lake phycodnavirus 4]
MSSGEVVQPEWCPQQESLVYKWAERAAGYRWLHNDARMRLKRTSDRLTYPTIIISSITGVGGFAVLSPDAETTTPSQRTIITTVQYIFATLNILSGILTSISKFSQSQKLSEAHSLMSIQYAKYYRSIDMELSLQRKDRVPVLEFVKKCKDDYDRMLSDAPDIPSECIDAFNAAFPDRVNKPDVCNGLNIMCQSEPRILQKHGEFSSRNSRNSRPPSTPEEV